MQVDREEIIKEILDLQKEKESLTRKIDALNNRKQDLLIISNEFRTNITTKCNQQIEFLTNEKDYISKKSTDDEQKIKKAFEEKLRSLINEKCKLERKLEAETEFVTFNLKARLAKTYNHTLELRSELYNRSKDLLKNLDDQQQDEEMKKKLLVSQNQTQAYELAKKIAEAHREIEGLYSKNIRLMKIMAELESKQKQNNYEHMNLMRTKQPRRNSYITGI